MALLFDLARTGSTLSPLANTATTFAFFLSLSLSSTVWQVEALLYELAVGQGGPFPMTAKNCWLLCSLNFNYPLLLKFSVQKHDNI
jgi:hypothetical protein